MDFFGLDRAQVWDTELAFEQLKSLGLAESKRTAERRLHELSLLPPALEAAALLDEFGHKPAPILLDWDIEQARGRRQLILFGQLWPLRDSDAADFVFHANDARGARYWLPLAEGPTIAAIERALQQLEVHAGKEIALFPHGQLTGLCRALPNSGKSICHLLSYPPVLNMPPLSASPTPRFQPPHLKRLEAESIFIIREAIAESENPVMLYSIGKDSSVMLHLARKAFFPAPPPFPLLHVDTRWKFKEMYLFRDYVARESQMKLIVHVNPEAIARDINPFDHGSSLHTDITKTEGLKQALDEHQFDLAFGGARRDEEKSRAKERIFSFRSPTHQWDPKNQRPEPWHLFNTHKRKGESMRVFPLSNWTELDIWQYILQEQIPVVPLYFAKDRPVVVRNGMILLVDDERMRLLPGETIQIRKVRFRTLGCYPLTGAVQSDATDLQSVILELANAKTSERQGRAIDADSSASMEKKKKEGYF